MAKELKQKSELFTLSKSDLQYALMLADQVEEFKKSIPWILEIAQKAQSEYNLRSKRAFPDLYVPEPVYEVSNSELIEEISRLRDEITKMHSGSVISYDIKTGSMTRTINSRTIEHVFVSGTKQKKLLNILIERRSFVSSTELMEIIDSKNIQSLSKMVGTVRDFIDTKFGFPEKFFIISTPKAGYRINPKVELQVIS